MKREGAWVIWDFASQKITVIEFIAFFFNHVYKLD
jgi:hypothetical protein